MFLGPFTGGQTQNNLPCRLTTCSDCVIRIFCSNLHYSWNQHTATFRIRSTHRSLPLLFSERIDSKRFQSLSLILHVVGFTTHMKKLIFLIVIRSALQQSIFCAVIFLPLHLLLTQFSQWNITNRAECSSSLSKSVWFYCFSTYRMYCTQHTVWFLTIRRQRIHFFASLYTLLLFQPNYLFFFYYFLPFKSSFLSPLFDFLIANVSSPFPYFLVDALISRLEREDNSHRVAWSPLFTADSFHTVFPTHPSSHIGSVPQSIKRSSLLPGFLTLDYFSRSIKMSYLRKVSILTVFIKKRIYSGKARITWSIDNCRY